MSNTSVKSLSYIQNQKLRLSSDIDSKRIHSSSIPIPIQLCFHSNEKHAYETMKNIFSSRSKYSSNLCDEFGCNILMYTLRYQRYKLFDYLLNDIPLDIDFRSKDRDGNTILHYAIVYIEKENMEIMEKLIEKMKKFRIEIDQRNHFGFTPLLLGIYCGRYDLGLILLTKAGASPFVRDFIQLKSILDYIEFDRESCHQHHTIRPYSSPINRESIRLRLQIHQIFPSRSETSSYSYKNFFENLFPQSVHDHSGSIRKSILAIFHTNDSSSNLSYFIHHLNQRYPTVKIQEKLQNIKTKQYGSEYENSKTNLHTIFKLFDPDLRPKAISSKDRPIHRIMSHGKTSGPFKRLGTKLAILNSHFRHDYHSKVHHLAVPATIK
ncbi:hypothetical protein I4U23_031170 [Adineta vaga]|nr:hypothetical protein I4U23_031170 [Adineta vaga]